MKRAKIILSVCYYSLVPTLFYLSIYALSLLLEISKGKDNLGFVMFVTYVFLFIFTPIFIAILMRFSPIKWVIDPFAAFEIPLFLYAAMILKNIKRSNLSFMSSFSVVNNKLNDDGGMGWVFLIGIFIFGVVFSISYSRVKEHSIFYRLTSKFCNNNSSVQ